MRHDKDLAIARTRADRFARLFALQAQDAMQDVRSAPGFDEIRVPSPSFARLFQARALLSLGGASDDVDTQAMIDTLAERRE